MDIEVVCGAPCSGKSTYVLDRKGDADVVVDLDEIAKAFGSSKDHLETGTLRRVAAAARKAAIQEVFDIDDGRAFIIHSSPDNDSFAKYRDAGASFTVLDPGSRELFDRARRDGRGSQTFSAIADWYERVMDDDHSELRSEIVRSKK